MTNTPFVNVKRGKKTVCPIKACHAYGEQNEKKKNKSTTDYVCTQRSSTQNERELTAFIHALKRFFAFNVRLFLSQLNYIHVYI